MAPDSRRKCDWCVIDLSCGCKICGPPGGKELAGSPSLATAGKAVAAILLSHISALVLAADAARIGLEPHRMAATVFVEGAGVQMGLMPCLRDRRMRTFQEFRKPWSLRGMDYMAGNASGGIGPRVHICRSRWFLEGKGNGWLGVDPRFPALGESNYLWTRMGFMETISARCAHLVWQLFRNYVGSLVSR